MTSLSCVSPPSHGGTANVGLPPAEASGITSALTSTTDARRIDIPTTSSPGLCDLPAELRQTIFSLVLWNDIVISNTSSTNSNGPAKARGRQRRVDLLLVCRLIHDDVQPLLRRLGVCFTIVDPKSGPDRFIGWTRLEGFASRPVSCSVAIPGNFESFDGIGKKEWMLWLRVIRLLLKRFGSLRSITFSVGSAECLRGSGRLAVRGASCERAAGKNALDFPVVGIFNNVLLEMARQQQNLATYFFRLNAPGGTGWIKEHVRNRSGGWYVVRFYCLEHAVAHSEVLSCDDIARAWAVPKPQCRCYPLPESGIAGFHSGVHADFQDRRSRELTRWVLTFRQLSSDAQQWPLAPQQVA